VRNKTHTQMNAGNSPLKFYPSSPSSVAESVTAVSPAFKKEATRVFGSIVLFLFVYFSLFLLSVAFVAACFYLAIKMVVNVPNLLVIFLAIGLLGMGVLVFIFLIKFLFSVTRHDRSNSIEIKEKDQPVLFAFIRQLTNDVATPFPKRIYLSADVNASVSYDSSFWSMFFPIRKNLQIGLGLINSLNLSEFKGVMAHEFGHFSQRSMKLGSYVYNVNHILHNMLFENNGYSRMLNRFGSADGIFALFAGITVHIARAIQWVLGKMYSVINKSYVQLSRQMEFHADAIAASVAGSKSLITALRRVEFSDAAFNFTISHCLDQTKYGVVSRNVYHNHLVMMKRIAAEHKLEMQNGLPLLNGDLISSLIDSRINFKDQWASHPPLQEREEHLAKLGVEAETNVATAWELFQDPESLQQQFTGKLFNEAIAGREITVIDTAEFVKKLDEDKVKLSLPAEYNGFYDQRMMQLVNLDEIQNEAPEFDQFSELFTPSNGELPKKLKVIEGDLEKIIAIENGAIPVKSFDFDGVKYGKKDAAEIRSRLETERDQLSEKIRHLDKQAVLFFLQKIPGENFLEDYREYFRLIKEAEGFYAHLNHIMQLFAPIFSGQTLSAENIADIVSNFKSNHEVKLKESLEEWLKMGIGATDGAITQSIRQFISSDYAYFYDTTFMDNELLQLHHLVNESWGAVNMVLFLRLKHLLNRQLSGLSKVEIAAVTNQDPA